VSCAESRGSNSRGKSLAKGREKRPIEAIEEADEDDVPCAPQPNKQRLKGKENVAQGTNVRKSSRKTKTFRANDGEEEVHQPKRRQPKKDQDTVDEREESTPDVESETDARPTLKRRNRIIQSVSSMEEPDEDVNPKKRPAQVKKAKGQVPIDELEPTDDRIDETGGPPLLVKKVSSKAPTKAPAKPEMIEESDDDDPGEVELTTRHSPSFKRDKEKAGPGPATPSETSEAAGSLSNDEEEVTQLPVPAEKPGRIVNGKGSKTARVATSHHEPSQAPTATTSGATQSSSMSLPPKGKAKATSSFQDVMDIDSEIDSTPATPLRGTIETTAKPPSRHPSESEPDADMDLVVQTPPTLRREMSPGTPPPVSSSLLSMSSTTSTTKVETHTDTETLVDSLPLRTNGAQLTEQERTMTVEQWIRHEIEVQYERLKQDGEMKIRLFKERAEEVRRQIEAL
jgi:hypothetical protein